MSVVFHTRLILEPTVDRHWTVCADFDCFVAGETVMIPAGFETDLMFHYFQYRREEFLTHYHRRSNVESCFSALKRKFGDSCRSKTDTAMKNEVLSKILAHNICVLIQEQHELGIDPVFWPGEDLQSESEPAILSMVSR